MNVTTRLRSRSALAAVVALALAGCGLPRTGPTEREIAAGSVQRQGDALIVEVDERVAAVTAGQVSRGFSSAFLDASPLGSDTIRPGDTLGLTIYENVEDGLIVGRGAPAAQLEEVQVDGDGYIFVPYAGRIRAAGNTPEAIRRLITDRLDDQTPDPQVQVRRLAGDGASVSVVGGVGSQGVYPIERPTRTLSAMLARAGGLSIPNEVAQVTVIRDAHKGMVWFDEIYETPAYDIALRDGDRILVEQDQRSFTALGATGKQAKVDFDMQVISAVEALSRVGGLSPALGNPKGVFVFRDEEEEVVERVLNRDFQGPQRMVYVIDLTSTNGMFNARDFVIRDGDTVYVTEAPYSQWQKVLSAVTGTVGSAGRISNVTGN